MHFVFPDLLGREALAHRPAQGEEREIVSGNGTTVREQLGVIQAGGQIERIKRRRDWHAVDVLVVISDGSHAKDLAIKAFDSFFWPENTGLRHPVILVDRKLPGSGFDGFGEKGLHRWLFNCAAGDGRNPELPAPPIR